MNYVIIGNSAAAIGCIEGIRQIDKEGSIILISNEPHHTYSRPLISYLLYGKTDEQRMKYRSDSFYKDNNVTALLGKTVVNIDKDKKTVALKTGENISYDKLLVATGSRPFIPPMQGLETVQNKTTFMSLDDAKRLESMLSDDARVLIIGAGLIGLKCAEGISDRVGHITVVDLADRILPSILDVHGSQMVQSHIEKKGVEFILSDSVAEFSESNAKLKSGKSIDFDVLVVAVGVRPNCELLKEAGAAVNRAILTDENCKTTIEDIYAAGDCTESFDITTSENRVLAILPNAYMQGETAGTQMAGGKKSYSKAIAMNAIGFFGLHIITAGNYNGEEYIEEKGDSYKKLVTRDGVLKGYILIGEVDRAGIYTMLIKEQTPLDTIDFELIRERPQLMAFSKKERAEKLGGGK